MEIYNEKQDINDGKVEISVFQNYGDQLTRYGIPPIFEGFWTQITVRKKDGTPLFGYPISKDDGKILFYKTFDDALKSCKRFDK